MSDPEIALYVSSNEVDHGPLSLKEASKRVQSGEFKPEDLAWHQGVSGWVPLKDLPEWNAMQAPPPLEKNLPLDKIFASGPPARGQIFIWGSFFLRRAWGPGFLHNFAKKLIKSKEKS